MAKEAPKPKGKLTYNEKREFEALESDIAKLEKQKQKIESQFANGEVDAKDVNDVSVKLQKIIEEMDSKEERWFELSAKIEG